MTIDGLPIAGTSWIDVTNPADGTLLAQAPDCSSEQLEAAVSAARSAFPSWAATAYEERQKVLHEMADAIEAHVEPLRQVLAREAGKTLDDARGEILGLAYWLRGISKLRLPETVNEDSAARRSVTRHVPLGVVGAIVPWNYPLGQIGFKLAPALLAGNTVVLKPSPFTPLATLRLGELLRSVVPPGAVNVVSGGDSLGPWMTAHPGIDKISFTGSTATGRKVMAGAAGSLKRVTLELGGNDPAIVLADIDVPTVAEKLFWGAFGHNGQVCLAAKRVYIHSDVYEPLKRALADYAATVRTGNGVTEDVRLGPLQNRPQYERILDLIRDCEDHDYSFLTGGLPEDGTGYFVRPTIIDNPPEHARIVQEEQFGPVLPLLKFDDIEDAITRANAGDYGLGASVWSADTDAALAVARRLEAGTVWINEIQHLTPQVTFGGLKDSGIGSENGIEGLLAFTAPQTITVTPGRS
ncbi:aldehyde dehydrogenase family protein [Actinacidiphila glaucinigra]|uniref:aldehyde dehydrogenase family protein n=1 Tax=Actinacidiphila glaucinigra TaxID=235986 RepID=UPI0035E3AE42